jgi:hypothetical protein
MLSETLLYFLSVKQVVRLMLSETLLYVLPVNR